MCSDLNDGDSLWEAEARVDIKGEEGGMAG